jgi:hypothetical protein
MRHAPRVPAVGRGERLKRYALVEAAGQMEQQSSAGLREGHVAGFIEDDEFEAGEIFGDASLAAGGLPEAISVGPLPVQMRGSPPRSAMSG